MLRLLFSSLCLLVLSCFACGDDPRNEANIETPAATELDTAQTTLNPADFATGLANWFDHYQDALPGMVADSFEQESRHQMDSLLTFQDARDPDMFRSLFIPSPDSSEFLDLYSYSIVVEREAGKPPKVYAENPDHEAALVSPTGQRQRLLFCGTACSFEAGFWNGPEEVVIAGLSSRADGYHPAIWHIDLNTLTIRELLYDQPLPDGTATYAAAYVAPKLEEMLQ